MFLSKYKKNNVYPCKPQFYYIKVGFKGVKLIQACFGDATVAFFLTGKAVKMVLHRSLLAVGVVVLVSGPTMADIYFMDCWKTVSQCIEDGRERMGSFLRQCRLK